MQKLFNFKSNNETKPDPYVLSFEITIFSLLLNKTAGQQLGTQSNFSIQNLEEPTVKFNDTNVRWCPVRIEQQQQKKKRVELSIVATDDFCLTNAN